MAKIEIIGPKNHFFDVLSLLHEEGTLHLEDLTKKIQTGEVPLEQMEVVENQAVELERMEDLLLRLRSILTALNLPHEKVDGISRQKQCLELWQLDSKDLAAQVTDVIEQVEDKTASLAQAQASMERELALLARYEPILHKIQPLAKQIVTTGTFDSVALLVERKYKGALEELKKELDEITKSQCEIVSTDVDDETTAVIVVFSKKYSEAVHKFLAMENVNQVRLPSEFQDVPFDVAYDQLKGRKSEIPVRLEQVRQELNDMSTKWYLKLSSVRDVLVDKIDEIRAIPKFGRTEYAFVVTGWMPVSDVKALRRLIYEGFKDDVIVNQMEIGEHDFEETPVALKNSKWLEPSAWVMSYLMGGKPQYGTVDPSMVWAISFPLIFGMIVGDIGYGAIMLAIILWMRFKFKDKESVQLATGLFGPAATAAIMFGIFYGEFFGGILWEADVITKIHLFGDFFLPYNREEFVIPLMVMALALGVIQMVFGLVLGAVNAVKTKHTKHAFVKGGLASLILGGIILGVSGYLLSAGIQPIGQMLGGAVMVAGVYAVLRYGGVMGAVETLELISHTASYIRIMAVGLSDAIFASAINKMAESMPFLVGVIVAVLFHALHLVLAAFTPTVHALRLNFYEFGQKYYETSNTEYEPFHKTGGEKSA
ncbi:MAG: V-type ATPase 116kDa subunit family protein [Coriobacteriia bacterium]|nr:V-type ATPase 116kDa subunit family protein [Coriobacteriia bacterium]